MFCLIKLIFLDIRKQCHLDHSGFSFVYVGVGFQSNWMLLLLHTFFFE